MPDAHHAFQHIGQVLAELCPDRRIVMVAPSKTGPPQAMESSLAETEEDCCTGCPIMVLPAVMERDGLSIPG